MNDLKSQFESYYYEYQNMVSALCFGYSRGDRDLTDDLIQDTFINLWKALPKFEGRSSPKTWIYRICVNTCLLHLRKNKNNNAEGLTAKHLGVAEESGTDRHFNELYQAIGQLKELDRIIIMMVLDDLNYSEIAEVMGMKEGSLRVRISRIKQQLNKLLRNGR